MLNRSYHPQKKRIMNHPKVKEAAVRNQAKIVKVQPKRGLSFRGVISASMTKS